MPRMIRAALAGALVTTTLALLSGCSLLPKEEDATPVLTAPVKAEKAAYTVHRGDLTEQVTLRARLAPARWSLFSASSASARATMNSFSLSRRALIVM